jgi:hypothetical protein
MRPALTGTGWKKTSRSKDGEQFIAVKFFTDDCSKDGEQIRFFAFAVSVALI